MLFRFTCAPWERCTGDALQKAELKAGQRPKRLCDNGACYVAAALKNLLQNKGITPVPGRRCHAQTLGHNGTLPPEHEARVVKLEQSYRSEEPTAALSLFVPDYNHAPYHEALAGVIPAAVYFGKREQGLKREAKINQQTRRQRSGRYFLNKQIL